MELFTTPEIQDYAERHTSEVEPLFEELRDETYRTMRSPQMQVGKLEGRLLRMLVQLCGARRVVEVGTFTGYSALMMASGLPDDGQLVTCDVDPKAAAVARRYFDKSPHGRKIEIRLGPAVETLRQLAPPFDLAFLDADKESYPEYFELLVGLLRPGGLLVVDNTLWSGEVLKPGDDDSRAIAALNAKAAADPRVATVLLPIRDGVTLMRKR